MGKVQKRKSLSIRPRIFARAQNYCARTGQPLAAFVEQLLTLALDEAGEPMPPEPKPKAPGELEHRARLTEAVRLMVR